MLLPAVRPLGQLDMDLGFALGFARNLEKPGDV